MPRAQIRSGVATQETTPRSLVDSQLCERLYSDCCHVASAFLCAGLLRGRVAAVVSIPHCAVGGLPQCTARHFAD
jgi:hypothetical protein